MGPELQLQLIAYRTAELLEEADNHRLAREAQENRKARPGGKRGRGLLGKIISA
ncbi:hypothetical protein OIE13_27665 [Streptosporangium sp. NBC_01810]|uniref:hypothetical protein n=1 Tax=Streptosporangium sp. NBC_01810 TaxID=2975951 RepID=UPI002DDBC312|nr:hypothetical protein [Streptosporangium sp. NBC_01810]WSA24689.1 hypothetical protein OIE13_27665 [Streptosporangium sp. NBC_01810]